MGEKTGTISDKVGSLFMTMNYELHYDDEQFKINNDTPDKVVREAFADLKQQATDEHEGIHDSKGFDFNDTIESPMAGYTMRVKFSSKPTTDVKKMNHKKVFDRTWNLMKGKRLQCNGREHIRVVYDENGNLATDCVCDKGCLPTTMTRAK